MRLALALLVLASPALAAPPPLKLVISAPKGVQLAKEQAALIDVALEDALKRPVEVVVAASGAKAVEALVTGSADAAWLSPVAYLEARTKAPIVPLATFVRDGSPEQKAVFIAREDGPKTLEAAAGKRVAWLGETSTSSTFARTLLAARRLSQPDFFLQSTVMPNHQAACKAVLEGRAEIGVTYAFPIAQGFDAELPSPDAAAPKGAAAPTLRIAGCDGVAGAEKLRVVAESVAFPNDVIAARVKLGAADRKALADALLGLSDTDLGRKALLSAFDAEGMRVADQAALDSVSKVFATLE